MPVHEAFQTAISLVSVESPHIYIEDELQNFFFKTLGSGYEPEFSFTWWCGLFSESTLIGEIKYNKMTKASKEAVIIMMNQLDMWIQSEKYSCNN